MLQVGMKHSMCDLIGDVMCVTVFEAAI